jgi:acetoin utilization deacetylase AcuC-like enzyme
VRAGLQTPHPPELIERTCLEVSGTVLTVQLALEYGLACNLAGGTHHAHRDFGSGFTILNDLAVATRAAQQREGVGKVVILDTDVHQVLPATSRLERYKCGIDGI